MSDQTGIIISILGFYLSLISILGSFFYIHLGNWVKKIQTTQQKWNKYKTRDRDVKVECYLEAFDEKSKEPLYGFLLLTGFMLILGWFAINLRSFFQAEASMVNFLYYPGYLFFVVYFVVSTIYLIRGYRQVNKLFEDIEKNLNK